MKCKAYIDPETGIALEGEALLIASKNPDSPRCGYELAQDDEFCSSCGATVEVSQIRNKQRASRVTFWGAVALLYLINILGFAYMSSLRYNPNYNPFLDVVFLGILGLNLLMSLYFIKISVRRLHDIGCSGWFMLPVACLMVGAAILTVFSSCTGFVKVIDWVAVIVNLGMVIWLGFLPGTKGANQYGPDPSG